MPTDPAKKSLAKNCQQIIFAVVEDLYVISKNIDGNAKYSESEADFIENLNKCYEATIKMKELIEIKE